MLIRLRSARLLALIFCYYCATCIAAFSKGVHTSQAQPDGQQVHLQNRSRRLMFLPFAVVGSSTSMPTVVLPNSVQTPALPVFGGIHIGRPAAPHQTKGSSPATQSPEAAGSKQGPPQPPAPSSRPPATTPGPLPTPQPTSSASTPSNTAVSASSSPSPSPSPSSSTITSPSTPSEGGGLQLPPGLVPRSGFNPAGGTAPAAASASVIAPAQGSWFAAFPSVFTLHQGLPAVARPAPASRGDMDAIPTTAETPASLAEAGLVAVASTQGSTSGAPVFNAASGSTTTPSSQQAAAAVTGATPSTATAQSSSSSAGVVAGSSGSLAVWPSGDAAASPEAPRGAASQTAGIPVSMVAGAGQLQDGQQPPRQALNAKHQ